MDRKWVGSYICGSICGPRAGTKNVGKITILKKQTAVGRIILLFDCHSHAVAPWALEREPANAGFVQRF